MNKKAKTICLMMVMSIIISCSYVAAAADSAELSKSTVNDIAQNYLKDGAYSAYMYDSKDLVSNTIDTLEAQQKKNFESSIVGLTSAKDVIPSEYQATLPQDYSLQSYRNKIEYFKQIRNKLGILRKDFSVDYQVDKTDIEGNFAKITLSEMISFTYSDCKEPTYIGTEYMVYLASVNDQWYIYEISSDDEQDSIFKDKNFDLKKALMDYNSITTYSEDGITHEVDGNICTVMSDVSNYRSYNKDNAAKYAYTYTTSGTMNQTSFYNSLFSSYSADCQNFASQCVWAGFGGDNSTSSINGTLPPMDNSGANRWYANPSSTYWAWTACSYFRSYLSASSSDTQTRMGADIYDVAGNVNSFSGLPIYTNELIGSVMHVYGQNGAYDHAIVINNVTGSTRNDIYFCAHTGHRKNAKLSDFWPAQATDVERGRLKIIVPSYFCDVKNCSGQGNHTYSSMSSGNGTDSTCNNCGYCRMYVASNWMNPVPVNSSVLLSATVSLQAYRIAMKVDAPNGSSYWLNQASNSSSISNNYTFSQTGLYTVTVIARDVNDSLPESVTKSGTFQVRVY